MAYYGKWACRMSPRVLEAMRLCSVILVAYRDVSSWALQSVHSFPTPMIGVGKVTNGVMQGCPLAFLRMNSIISAWARTAECIVSTAACSIGAYMDDKNARGTSLQQLQHVVQLTESFDEHTDAVVRKTVTFATTPTGRKSLPNVLLNNQPVQSLSDERLLGAQAYFTMKRAGRWPTNVQLDCYLPSQHSLPKKLVYHCRGDEVYLWAGNGWLC